MLKKKQTVWFLKAPQSIKGKPCARGFSLPGVFYTDPRWTQTESSELFGKQWFCVGRVEEAERPGDFFSFEHVGEPLLVVHGRDSVIRVLANVCRHRGTLLDPVIKNYHQYLSRSLTTARKSTRNCICIPEKS